MAKPPKAPKKRKKRKPRREMLRRRFSKEKQVTKKVISMRHKVNLMHPGRPFRAGRQDFRSECFAKFEYDPKTFSLKVWFWAYKQRGISGVYILWDIAQWEYEEFLQASSKGRHFYYTWRDPTGSRIKPFTEVG